MIHEICRFVKFMKVIDVILDNKRDPSNIIIFLNKNNDLINDNNVIMK
jgi:hypothetical protein